MDEVSAVLQETPGIRGAVTVGGFSLLDSVGSHLAALVGLVPLALHLALRLLSPEVWPCPFHLRLENSLDLAHLPSTHHASSIIR
mgnify:CR=1 FL=1